MVEINLIVRFKHLRNCPPIRTRFHIDGPVRRICVDLIFLASLEDFCMTHPRPAMLDCHLFRLSALAK